MQSRRFSIGLRGSAGICRANSTLLFVPQLTLVLRPGTVLFSLTLSAWPAARGRWRNVLTGWPAGCNRVFQAGAADPGGQAVRHPKDGRELPRAFLQPRKKGRPQTYCETWNARV
jgi:hypothetical protein